MALSLQRYMQPNGSSPLIRLLKERSIREHERAISITIQNADRLDENVIIEILSWLPVRSLLRYKSVCKSWYAIISSPDFISKHLKNYYNNNCDWRGFLLTQYHIDQCELQTYVLFVDETHRVLAREQLFDMPVFSSFIYGPCDGLYYLYEAIRYPLERAIWNPAINEFKFLPPLITKPNPPLNTVDGAGEDYGFGHDPKNGDYKVVVIKGYLNTINDDSDYPQSIFVYSLRNDSWKYCGDLGRYYWFKYSKCCNFVNGCCYWLESIKHSLAIVSFDMATDAFEEISLPDYIQLKSDSNCQRCLAIYDKNVALLCVHPESEFLDIWALKDGIWSLRFTMGPFQDIARPIGHWGDNKVILESVAFKLLVLDLESKEIKHLACGNFKPCNEISICKESLVSINKGESCHGKGEDHNVTKHDRSPVEINKCDLDDDFEFGIRELFYNESDEITSECDFGFEIHELFHSESGETTLEF
ncbi:hypothetical protein RND81_09G173800 [Saponaria officinalis]|uniref:F-box domain-containing protein n=1 Tax=Saponaria officinalis TaxID=3572 RepID=A0AAW1IPE5_SAPOF